MKTTILAAAAVAALCASPARAAVGNWSIPQFVDDYPADIKRYWTEQVNGIAHDDGNWFFTMPNSTLAPPLILKVPAGLDLNEVDIAPHPLDGHGIYDEGDGILLDWGVGGDAVAGEDSNFDHFGDLDQYLGYLFVPVERDGSTMGIAVFRAADLGYVGLAKVQQSSAGWLAYNTQDNYLYSSDEFISPGRGIYR
jgi:hypothetical protein